MRPRGFFSHVRLTSSLRATRKTRVAGVGSSTPSELMALTMKTWSPCCCGDRVNGLAQAMAKPSTWQRNVEPGIVEAKRNCGVVFHVAPLGPLVMVVSGGGAMRNVRVALALSLRALSLAMP